MLDTYHVIDHEDPTEPRNGAPTPTIHDVGVLAILIERAQDELEQMQRHLRDVVKLREPAVYLLGTVTDA